MARADLPVGAKRKLIEFDAETWRVLHTPALDRMSTIQELADEAFADLLKKHNRPVTLKEALSESAGQPSRQEQRKARMRARRGLEPSVSASAIWDAPYRTPQGE